MSENIIPSILRKNITFRRLSQKSCSGYEIYGEFKDSTIPSGKRLDLLDKFDNPSEPSPITRRIDLLQEKEPTWQVPYDAFIDRNHKPRLYQNGHALANICYDYNRITRLITLNTNIKEYSLDDKMELEYWVDVIKRSYNVEDDCRIIVRPIFSQDYGFGDHNIII